MGVVCLMESPLTRLLIDLPFKGHTMKQIADNKRQGRYDGINEQHARGYIEMLRGKV